MDDDHVNQIILLNKDRVREKVFFETIFKALHEGVVVIERNLKISYANYAALHLLDLPENYVGQRISSVLRQVDWEQYLNPTVDNPSMVRHELELFYPFHRFINFYIIFLKVTESLDKEKGNNLPFAAVVIQDITESVKKVEMNIEAEKMEALTLLTSGVAHELGNPLNNLSINLQILQRVLKRIDDEELRKESDECLQISLQEVTRLDGIIRHFLHAVRPTPLQIHPVQIIKILQNIVTFKNPEIENRKIKIVITNDIVGIPVNGDSEQLWEAFFNLITNAIQAMRDGGTLSIHCFENSNFVNISFKDDAGGIPLKIFPQIMNTHFTTKKEGNGLGLMIVERIIRAHGGTLSIESREGEGTVFTLKLPIDGYRSKLLED